MPLSLQLPRVLASLWHSLRSWPLPISDIHYGDAHVLLCPPGLTSNLGHPVFTWLTRPIPKPSWLPLLDFHFNVLEWPAVTVTLQTSMPQRLRCRQCKHASVQTIIISCTDVYKNSNWSSVSGLLTSFPSFSTAYFFSSQNLMLLLPCLETFKTSHWFSINFHFFISCHVPKI